MYYAGGIAVQYRGMEEYKFTASEFLQHVLKVSEETLLLTWFFHYNIVYVKLKKDHILKEILIFKIILIRCKEVFCLILPFDLEGKKGF